MSLKCRKIKEIIPRVCNGKILLLISGVRLLSGGHLTIFPAILTNCEPFFCFFSKVKKQVFLATYLVSPIECFAVVFTLISVRRRISYQDKMNLFIVDS